MSSFRISDLIVAALDEDKVKSIINLVSDEENMDEESRAASLVLSGVALGVEEAMSRIEGEWQAPLIFLRSVLEMIDAQLDQSPTLEVSSALAILRTPIAERTAALVNTRLDSYCAKAYTAFGIGRDILVSANCEAKDYPQIDLIALGAEVFRRSPGI